jgi:nucleotide-binding universal stress UspA family protein
MPATERFVQTALDRIVLATDFSPASESATNFARHLATHFRSKVTVVNVVDLSVATRSEQAVVGLPIDEIHSTSNKSVEALTSELHEDGIQATGHVLEAHNPAAAVVNLARDVGANLVVIGTHSRHGLNKFILGSCAEGIIRHSVCPVMTVGPKVKGPVAGDFQNVLFATELHAGAIEKARVAFEFVDRDGKMWLVHVIEQPGRDMTEALATQLKFESELDRLARGRPHEWCEPQFFVDYGRTASKILQVAHNVKADLIVLGARRSASWFSHLRDGTVDRVIADASCPVLTIGF